MGRIRCCWLTSLSSTVGFGLLCGSFTNGYLTIVPFRARYTSPGQNQAIRSERASRLLSTPTPQYRYVALKSIANFNATNENSFATNARNDSHTLWTFVYNLQRARRAESVDKNGARVSKERDAIIKSSLSLASFLETHTCLQDAQRPYLFTLTDSGRARFDDTLGIVEPLRRAVVQSLRGVSVAASNDYRLILRLFNAAIAYADFQPILDPIVAKETILALGRTKDVNMNKIRSVWNKATGATTDVTPQLNTTAVKDTRYGGTCWTRTVGPMEVNAILQVLIEKGKLPAAMDLFNKEHNSTRTDAYSVSILLNALTASLPDPRTYDDTPRQSSRNRILSLPEPIIQSDELKPLISTSSSLAWQWNHAMLILDQCVSRNREENCHLNNPVFTALLQFNRRIDSSMPRRSQKHVARTRYLIRWVIDFMKQENIQPDHVTSTLILSSLDESSWELAVVLLKGSNTEKSNNTWTMPRPNVYMYSAAMAVCARSRQHQVAMKLLNEMEDECEKQIRSKSDDTLSMNVVKPGVYVYNAVLQALVGKHECRVLGSKRLKIKSQAAHHAKERLVAALELYGQMKVQPDIVTFNTLLAVMASSARPLQRSEDACRDLILQFPQFFGSIQAGSSAYLGHENTEHFVAKVFKEMRDRDVSPDSITYVHAIRAVSETDRNRVIPVVTLVDRGIHDSKMNCNKIMSAMDVCNAGLSVFANVGSVQGVGSLLLIMRQRGLSTLSSDGMTHVVNTLGNANMTTYLPSVLSGGLSMTEGLHALEILSQITLPRLTSSHYVTAITACLRVSDFESARQILLQMRKSGVEASNDVLEQIAKSYAVLALDSDTKIKASKVRSSALSSNEQLLHASMTCARSAFALLSNIGDPPAALISLVAKACCSTGMVEEAQSLLRILHKRVLHLHSEQALRMKQLATEHAPDDNEKALPRLHRYLLNQCAEQGDVTNALRFCEDIQYLSSQLVSASSLDTSQNLPMTTHDEPSRLFLTDQLAYVVGFGMTSSCWKSLIVAAAKSGHWRVCLSSLQFLRPYLEATNPTKATSDDELLKLTETYGRLESTLNNVVQCLAVRSQYGWIVRAIDDWIEWCGRRPPRQAVLEAVRILATRGRGEEVNSLLVRCTSIISPATKKADHSYISMLFVGTITSLYNEGLYDSADDAFVAAIAQQSLPFNVERHVLGNRTRLILDLHGMNVAVAHCAVRIALQQEAASVNWSGNKRWKNDMVIITGRGLHSVYFMRPVLRPAVQRMLVEEFYPPLSTTSVPGNMGAIRISSSDISEWLEHQRQQKGVRLLVAAAMLKNIASPGGLLKAALSKVTTSR